MNESGVWQYIKKGMLTSGWHVTRIESSSGNGVPDITFGLPKINGWIELKYVPEWPKLGKTKIKLPLRPEQKYWINCRGELSGNVWVIVRIKDTFFLLDHEQAVDACEGWTLLEWMDKCTERWDLRIDFSSLKWFLSKYQTNKPEQRR